VGILPANGVPACYGESFILHQSLGVSSTQSTLFNSGSVAPAPKPAAPLLPMTHDEYEALLELRHSLFTESW